MTPARDKDGYLQVQLQKDGKRRTKKLHRLVLEVFVGPAPSDYVACHQDGNKQNNCLENLEWNTQYHNQVIDGIEQGTFSPFAKGEANIAATLKSEQVVIIKRLAKMGLTHQRIADLMGVQRRNVGKIIQGIRWKHVG